ncbi:uncharacterized protein Z520_10994 [Fonsecaea multimorphosa CBS 102226]|uniref:Inner kinetochore subunit AME1 domain-containing protein n=1 Tax=Fonsecaea multimorphosa CBS 102226 TaxID=1442371 RepID=A0A0D2I836_9EURO|nr:uncharacterized protein Z520_10994 [Fonsecaea multimorphosa CBS 102226]KIX93351.1 hypothetical protein Z520_10994 [Fonsecaea multimorphosa CBS 102226]OAL18588.1 hypothetical protein AYO22_10565 [Fonsecaea multimorphosa]
MASDSRQDRALMRQRGAGSRAVATADFGISFGLGDNRLERQQMRQRGAGSRKIDNVDFGISFPTPAQRSHTKTPQSRRSTLRQSSHTPARRSREPTSARSTRRNSSRQNSAQPTAPAPEPEVLAPHDGPIGANIRSSKRRKISPAVVTPTPQPPTVLPRPMPTTRASVRRNSTPMFTIAEDDDARVPPSVSQAGEHSQTSPLFVPEGEYEKENETPNTIGSKTNPMDWDLQTTKSGRILAPFILDEDVTESASAATGLDGEGTRQRVMNNDTLPDSDVPGSSRQPKRRKRKPRPFVRRKRRSSNQNQLVDTSKERSPAAVSSRTPVVEIPSFGTQPLADRITKYSKLARMRNMRGVTPVSDREQTPNQGEEEDESYVEQSSSEAETPAASMKSKRKTRQQISQNGSAEVSKSNKGRPTFPILTHRLASVSILPTINEEGEASMGDALPDVANHRNHPNVVDVLAQICRETISNAIDRLAETEQPNKRISLNNKRSALEAFGKDLDDELFAMSEAVENRFDLEARVRKTKREKAALQTEYIELRKEREQVALKCDALRRRHWQCEESTREKWTLSEAARRVEQEMDRNPDADDESIEFLIRSVTASSSASGHGILDKVMSFNAQLENMALFLERGNVA